MTIAPNHKFVQNLYEQFHKIPEPAFQEWKTAGLIAEKLTALGYEVRTNIGKTGLIGVLRCGQSGPCVALRSDMDALRITEETGVSFASENPGLMHACGHDSHISIALGCALYVAENRHSLKGTFMILFQPAEEIVAGAKAMLAEDIFADQKPDLFLAMHNWPYIPEGSVGIQPGPITAFSDRFVAEFFGRGGHGALPHKTIDSIAMATAAVQSAYALLQRQGDPQYPQSMSVGLINGGTTFNIIPDSVKIEGTVRTMVLSDQQRIQGLLDRAFSSAAALHGGKYSLDYQIGVPAVVNEPKLAGDALAVLKQELPELTLFDQGLQTLVGEDVGYFFTHAPGILVFVGSRRESGNNELHHPKYIVPEKTLQVGLSTLTTLLKQYLQ